MDTFSSILLLDSMRFGPQILWIIQQNDASEDPQNHQKITDLPRNSCISNSMSAEEKNQWNIHDIISLARFQNIFNEKYNHYAMMWGERYRIYAKLSENL